MPEHKNQHYVPQHFLRGWSVDGQISVYHIEDGPIPVKESIKHACSEDYLYGNPTHVEEKLGELESLHQKPLGRLRDGGTLPDIDLERRRLLLSFVATQRARSLLTRQDIDSGEHVIRDAIKDDLEDDVFDERIEWHDDFTIDEKEDRLTDASLRSIHMNLIIKCMFGHLFLGDLEGVILRNVADEQFVVSDVRIVLDNPRFKQSQQKVLTGFSEAGLQIFCPIDPARVLLLYDPSVYSFDSNSRQHLLLKSQEVVNEVNLLQFHNSDSIVMHHSCSKEYLNNLAERMSKFRSRQKVTQTMEPEDGEKKEVKKVPPHQVPAKSPDIPGCKTYYTEYTNERYNSHPQYMREIVHKIKKKADGFPDVGAIVAIEIIKELYQD